MEKKREHFGSAAAAVMAMAGSAIGLGNIWRFPYLVGQNGGAAFIIIYLIAAFVLSLPILISEAVIGKKTHRSTFGAMNALSPGTGWKWLGLLTVITPMIILSYYSVVGGWSIEYFMDAVVSGFGTGDSAGSLFSDYITSTWSPLIFHTVFLLLTAFIVSAGVKSGIERFNNISLPILFVLIVVIMIYSLSLPGSEEGVRYMLEPHMDKITPSVIASAMGQSFFSMSLGVGTILTYASYMKKEDSILATGVGTTFFDMVFALLAGFAIMPAVFAAGIEPGAGPGLIFETLPYVFSKMSIFSPLLSRAVSIMFFLAIVIAALTSSVSILEVGVAYLVEEKNLSRKKSVVLLFVLTWVVGALCSMSFGRLSGITLFGMNLFSFFDILSSNYLMTFGSLLFVLFVGWKMKKSEVGKEFTNSGTLKVSSRLFGIIYFLIRYIAPLVIVTIFITSLIIK